LRGFRDERGASFGEDLKARRAIPLHVGQLDDY
jgi:hypothetical protein